MSLLSIQLIMVKQDVSQIILKHPSPIYLTLQATNLLQLFKYYNLYANEKLLKNIYYLALNMSDNPKFH